MEQLGHTDPGFTLRVYRHGMRRDKDSKAQLQALVQGIVAVDSGGHGPIEGAAVPVESNGHASEAVSSRGFCEWSQPGSNR
jgi:hypothetical protein